MPTYQYACTACGHQLEAVQSFTDQPLTECPACDGRLRKLFSAVGIVFKGSGFYRTDSRAAAESANGQKGKDDASTKEPASAGASSSGDSSSGSTSSSSPSGSSSGDSSSSGSSSGDSSSSGSSSGDSSSSGSSASGRAKSNTKKVATTT